MSILTDPRCLFRQRFHGVQGSSGRLRAHRRPLQGTVRDQLPAVYQIHHAGFIRYGARATHGSTPAAASVTNRETVRERETANVRPPPPTVGNGNFERSSEFPVATTNRDHDGQMVAGTSARRTPVERCTFRKPTIRGLSHF